MVVSVVVVVVSVVVFEILVFVAEVVVFVSVVVVVVVVSVVVVVVLVVVSFVVVVVVISVAVVVVVVIIHYLHKTRKNTLSSFCEGEVGRGIYTTPKISHCVSMSLRFHDVALQKGWGTWETRSRGVDP